ncbi:hypothetical protein U6R20_12200, partial [Cutibacterium acnes]
RWHRRATTARPTRLGSELMTDTKIIEFKSRRQRDIEEIVTEVQRLEASGQFSSETADLVGFVSTLKSVKNLKVYDSQGKPIHLAKDEDQPT